MPADPRRVKDLFAAALDLTDVAARRAFLDRECGADLELRARLAALLAAHAEPESALERPLGVPAPTGPFTPSSLAAEGTTGACVGQIVAGRYKLLERIGEGGMGEVWVAEQQEPIRRRVALKMIKPGMDSRAILARFEAERQALALMDHPNIAKVLDAGTAEAGAPFFAMELVKGTPITEFCDARRLSPRERLELFVPVCRAIQHAHQKGVIHRDIKPTNVLVALHDEEAVPKVIDFGVVKAIGQQLTEKTLYTGFGALIGTPAYMAPEQATFNQLDIDTRADVYALGVLLYELLAGSPPFDPERLKRAALDEVLRLVREEEPQRPSARLSTSRAKATIAAVRQTDPVGLARLVRGELDWIVMRAIEKDRNRRYESAVGLAKDVERYLRNEPVEACPPTLGYRLRKFAGRHKAALFTTAAFAGLLLTAAAFGGLLAVQARRAEVAADDRRQEAEHNRDEALHNFGLFKGALRTAEENKADAERERDEAASALKKLKFAQEEQRASQYVWDMQLLPLAFESNNVAEVNRVLDRHLPQPGQTDRRGFEWFYWKRQLHTDLRTDRLPEVTQGRRFVEWVASPDGSRVARFTTPVGGNGEPEDPPTLLVWDVATRKVLLKHRMSIEKPVNQSYTSLSPKPPLFSPGGNRVAVEWGFLTPGAAGRPGGRHLQQVVDVTSGKVLLNLEGEQGQGGLGMVPRGPVDGAFSSDGCRFASVRRTVTLKELPATSAEVRVWDLESGQEVCRPLDATALAETPFTPDGACLVTQKRQASGTRVSVWDLASGHEKARWDVANADLSSLALSPNGTRVAGATSNRLRVTLRPARAKGETPLVEPQVKIWDTAGKELYSFAPPGLNPSTSTMRVFFGPGGAQLAVLDRPAEPAPAGDLTIWDVATGKLLPLPAGLEVHSWSGDSGSGPAFSPDGKQIVTVEANVVRTWDVQTGRPVLSLRGHVNPIVARGITADGSRLWSLESGGLLKEWDLRPGRVEIRFVGPIVRSAFDLNPTSVSEFAVGPDGGRVAALIELRTDLKANAPGTAAVQIWDVGGTSVQILRPPARGPSAQRPAYGLALSRDGRRVALTRYETGLVFARGQEAAPPPDITVWDVESKAVLLNQQLEPGHAPLVTISPDGKTVAVVSGTGARGRPRIRVFDLDGKRERTPLTAGEAAGISSLTFSPDGRKLAGFCTNLNLPAGHMSARIAVWEVESGAQRCAVELFGNRPIGAGITTAVRIAWAPDGSRFVFSPDVGRNSELAVHDAVTAKKALTLAEPVTAGAATSGVQYVAYSPDGKRIAALQLPRTVGGAPTLKMWDAASGKELLSLRPQLSGETLGGRFLTFTSDGRALRLAELAAERQPRAAGGGASGRSSLLLTAWDATPVPESEQRKP